MEQQHPYFPIHAAPIATQIVVVANRYENTRTKTTIIYIRNRIRVKLLPPRYFWCIDTWSSSSSVSKSILEQIKFFGVDCCCRVWWLEAAETKYTPPTKWPRNVIHIISVICPNHNNIYQVDDSDGGDRANTISITIAGYSYDYY